VFLFGDALAHEIAEVVVEHRVTPTVSHRDAARAYAAAAAEPLEISLKVDTGAHRFGVLPDGAADLARAVAALPSLRLALVYTIFADPAGDEAFTCEQFRRFRGALDAIRAAGVDVPRASCATSAVVSTRPEMYLDAVRSGNLVYGLYLPPEPPVALRLQPAARALRTRIVHTQWVEAGETMGYRRPYTTGRRTRYAVIPVGRTDGLARGAAERGSVLVRGARCPFIPGSVSGEHSGIDVTDVPGARIGDEVALWGEQDGAAIALSEHALWAEASEAEVVTALGRLIQHRYLRGGGAP
jgi:alanine racemase